MYEVIREATRIHESGDKQAFIDYILHGDGKALQLDVLSKKFYQIGMDHDVDSYTIFSRGTVPWNQSLRYAPVPKFSTRLTKLIHVKLNANLTNCGADVEAPKNGVEFSHMRNIGM